RANGQVANSGLHGNMKTSGQFENRPGNAQANSGANSGVTARQRELSQNRPPSAMPNGNRSTNGPAGNSNLARAGNGRTWEAQGNATERGRAQRGLDDADGPANASEREPTAQPLYCAQTASSTPVATSLGTRYGRLSTHRIV